MIVRPRPGVLQLFFIARGSVVPRILPQIIGFAAYSAIIVAVLPHIAPGFGDYGVTPFGLLGVTLSIYLGFRNNAAYDRWWEARKLWGQMVYDIRNLARAGLALLGPDHPDLRPLLRESLAFCHLLRGALREIDTLADAQRFADGLSPTVPARNLPDAILRGMGARIGDIRRAGAIDAIGYRILDERLSALAAVQAGCERIAGTPLPFAYTLLVHRAAYIFCLALPFGLVHSAGWATPFFTALLAYSFFGLDELSAELEDPFGTEANDLALDALCRVCEISVAEALGEDAPAPLAAERYYYS